MSTSRERSQESPPEIGGEAERHEASPDLAPAPVAGGSAGPLLRPSPGAVTGIDDVRAPLDDSPSGVRIRRRDLLAWGGAAAMLPAFSGVARAQEALAASAAIDVGPRPMSVGYIVGSDQWPSFKKVTGGTLNRGLRVAEDSTQTAPAEVVPASSLIAGTQELANQSVRVRVHGLYPIPNPTGVQSLYLSALFAGTEAGLPQPVPFLAWGYKSVPAPDPAAPISFPYPIGADGAVSLLLEVTPARNGRLVRRPSVIGPAPSTPGGKFTARFTVDWFAGQPKLQRGVYLLGLAGDTWNAARTLPVVKPGQSRPVELVSLMVSFDPIAST